MEINHLTFINKKLNLAITAVCPINGISIGNILDKSTWRIDFTVGATQNQKNAAQSILDSFDVNASDLIQTRVDSRQIASKASAKNIPNWAGWTEAQALQWLLDNIGTPLTTPIPANPMTVQQIRIVLVNIVAVLNQQYLVDQSMARMIVAFRDGIWPDLPET